MRLITVGDLYFLSVMMLIKIVNWFSSYQLKECIVEGLTFGAFYFSREKRRLIEKNLSKTFEESLKEDQRRKVIRGAFYEFWDGMFSLLPSPSERDALQRVEVRGLDYLQGALKKGTGVILWESNGFGRRAVAKQVLHQKGYRLYQVHGVNNLGGFLVSNSASSRVRYAWIKRLFDSWEKQFIAEIIDLPSTDSLAFTRTLLNLLKENAILCISGDGKTGKKFIRLRFLGGSEFFSTGMISLSMMSGASILPMFCLRKRNGESVLIIERPIDITMNPNREHGLECSIAQYADLLESYIRRHPEQYRNWHLVGCFSEP